MATEVEIVIWFGDGFGDGEPPNREELEAAIQRRYPDSYVVEYEEEEEV